MTEIRGTTEHNKPQGETIMMGTRVDLIANGGRQNQTTQPHGRIRGFTLVELMIVVVIIGILAALAIPRFMSASTKTKQTEAKQILKQIYVQQRAYRVENDAYWGNGLSADAANPNNFARILVEIGSTSRYTYSLVADATTFTATATAANPGLDTDPAPDTWTMDQLGNLTATSDDSQL